MNVHLSKEGCLFHGIKLKEGDLCCKKCYNYKSANNCKYGFRIVDASYHYCKYWQYYKIHKIYLSIKTPI